jgi:hypothetical protein
MAKKVTDLEKRKSKIEELGLNALPSKVKELETKVAETAEMKTLENTQQLACFDKQLSRFVKKQMLYLKKYPLSIMFSLMPKQNLSSGQF